MTKKFLGDCIGVRLTERGSEPDDNHIMINIDIEDDENWFPKLSVSSAWLDEMIEQLQIARDYIKTQEPHMADDVQYGYKFKK